MNTSLSIRNGSLVVLFGLTGLACNESFFRQVEAQCQSEYPSNRSQAEACATGVRIAKNYWKSDWNSNPPSQEERNSALQQALVQCRKQLADPTASHIERNSCQTGVRLVHRAGEDFLAGKLLSPSSKSESKKSWVSNRQRKSTQTEPSHYDQDRVDAFREAFTKRRSSKRAD